ncbi:hypothetical protein YC2023_107207 [Brassica napus]
MKLGRVWNAWRSWSWCTVSVLGNQFLWLLILEGQRLFELYFSFEENQREIEVFRSDCSFVGRLPPSFASLWGVGRMRRMESTIKVQWRVLVGIEGSISMIFSPGVIYECVLVMYACP